MRKRTNVQSPWIQAGRLAFLALYAVTAVAAMGWLFSNVREIGPDKRAVVLRMGELNRIHASGLLLALPRPFEEVVILPAAERVIEQRVDTLVRSTASSNVSADASAGSGYSITGDTGVVLLSVRVFYNIVTPYAWVLQQQTLRASLNRIVERNVVAVCASRDLDTILVARPELLGTSIAAVERRERLRRDLLQGINNSLMSLEAGGGGLGIRVERVNVQSSLPGEAVSAFNAVLSASQLAEQNIASATNDAESRRQAATQEADRILQVAQAQAKELLTKAQVDTTAVTTLATSQDPGLLQRVYREKVTEIFSHAGAVTTVDPNDAGHMLLQGPQS